MHFINRRNYAIWRLTEQLINQNGTVLIIYDLKQHNRTKNGVLDGVEHKNGIWKHA